MLLGPSMAHAITLRHFEVKARLEIGLIHVGFVVYRVALGESFL